MLKKPPVRSDLRKGSQKSFAKIHGLTRPRPWNIFPSFYLEQLVFLFFMGFSCFSCFFVSFRFSSLFLVFVVLLIVFFSWVSVGFVVFVYRAATRAATRPLIVRSLGNLLAALGRLRRSPTVARSIACSLARSVDRAVARAPPLEASCKTAATTYLV